MVAYRVYKLINKGLCGTKKLSSMSISLREKSHKKNRLTEDSVLGVLNRHYAWNMPGVRDKGSRKVISANKLMFLSIDSDTNNK